jgi:hypothetical protein
MMSAMTTTTEKDAPLVARIGASAATTESRALYVAVAALVLGFLVGMIFVAGRSMPISGRDSLGTLVGFVSAVFAAVVFAVGYLLPAPGASQRQRPERSTWRLVLNIVALALAHAAIALLLMVGLSIILADAFIGAVVFPFSSAVIIGIGAALVSYTAYLSAAGMTTTRVATVLAVFLVLGVITSMLSTTDPLWWEKNISALGIGGNLSSATFNLTLLVAGAIITAIASYLAAELATGHLASAPREADDRRERTRIEVLRWALIALGVFLACVGIFPVDWVEWVHNTFATGLVVIFAALVVAIRWIVPRLPLVFVLVGYGFLVVVLGAVVFFALGIYNLTAVEIIGFALIFTWLILLIRNISAGSHDAAHSA